MTKLTLWVAISLCAFILAVPTLSIAGTNSTIASPKQPLPKKSSGESAKKRSKKIIVVNGKRKTVYRRVAYTQHTSPIPAVITAGDLAGLNLTPNPLALSSNAALVVDQMSSQVLFEKNAEIALPIASLTKLMTALIVVEARQNMDELLEITVEDIDREKFTSSRLRIGARMRRSDMLHIALMSSENRAASALGRYYPGGIGAFVIAMNTKAKMLKMMDTHYVDSTGLSSHNVSSARDLAKLAVAAYQHPIIREYSTDMKYSVDAGGHYLQYINSNRLVTHPDWEIGLQKTGYISEAGRCLIMQAKIDNRLVVMVFLDSKGKQSRLADAGRIRKWLENNKPPVIVQAGVQQS